MFNPVFHRDTKFLSQSVDGAVSYRDGSENISLDGVTVNLLNERQSLVRIETTSGASITLSPESVFSLRQHEGRLVRYLPFDLGFIRDNPTIDWTSDDPEMGQRRFALVGMIVASGVHSTDPSRASNVVLPAGALATHVVEYLHKVAKRDKHGKIGTHHKPTVREVQDFSVFIKSRSLTHAAARLIEPKTQDIQFDPMALAREDLWAFAAGLLSSAKRSDAGVIITHRSVKTLRVIAATLALRFGVTGTLTERPFEKEVMSSNTGATHSLFFDGKALSVAKATGLYDGECQDRAAESFKSEAIAKIEPLAHTKVSVIVTGSRPGHPFPLTANTFVFNSEFEVNADLIDLAAHPVFQTDPSDPADILSRDAGHFAGGIRVND